MEIRFEGNATVQKHLVKLENQRKKFIKRRLKAKAARKARRLNRRKK